MATVWQLVELKNGETYNGHLVNCDTWMNIHLREVICTSKDGDRFWRMPECYIRGNTIKYLRVPDEVIDKVQEETKTRSDRKPPGVGRGRGRGRDDNAAGRPSKGTGRGIDDGGSKGGGRGKGVVGSKSSGRVSNSNSCHMTDIKEDVDHHRHLILPTEAPKLQEEEEEKAKPQQISKPKRVASLDIFRGLTVALMILVDDAGGEWPVIGHAPWNGCNLADFVMPFFLFIVGMAIPLAFKRIQDRITAISKVILRTLKLLFWGLLLQGGFSHAPDKLTYGVDMKKIRWCGILQRIALAYLVVSFVEIATRNSLTKGLLPGKFSVFKLYFWHWMVGACVLTVYLGTLYGTYVPDWQFTVQNTDSSDFGKVLTVACNVRGKLDPPCNAVGYIDRKVLGINHMYPHPAWKRSKIHWIQKHIFIKVWHSRRVGILLYVIFAEILFWGIVAGILHRLSIYWKL
ncbi:UNVERIFIED_CONTAM: putative U6 snRNA-associated Sm-like protein LSm4 [Sesamum indicum]